MGLGGLHRTLGHWNPGPPGSSFRRWTAPGSPGTHWTGVPRDTPVSAPGSGDPSRRLRMVPALHYTSTQFGRCLSAVRGFVFGGGV